MSFRDDWKARRTSEWNREWQRHDRINRQRKVAECLLWWEKQQDALSSEPTLTENAAVAP